MLDSIINAGPAGIMIEPGKVLPGRVIAKEKGRVLVDLGGTTTGVVSGKELIDGFNTAKALNIGDEVLVFVLEDENEEGMVVLSFRKAAQMQAWDKFLKMKESKETIQVIAREANKGGLMVDAMGVKAFLPVSQLAPEHYPRVDGANAEAILEHLGKFIGQKFTVCVITINEESRKLVVSEREALQKDRIKELKDLTLGSTVQGRIHGLVKFGAFMTFGKLEGLIHISEISWGHIKTPGEALKVGQDVEAMIIGIDEEKISLSIKRLTQDPWVEAVKNFAIGSRVPGTISKITDFGMFIALTESITGLVHKSQFSEEDVAGFTEGQAVEVTIMEINEKDHSLKLTFKDASQITPTEGTQTEEAPKKAKKTKEKEDSEEKEEA